MLKCYIVGRNKVGGIETQYKIADGAVFTENYNETLDSGTIVLPHLTQEIEIEPYDVVVIFSTDDSGVKINQKRLCVDTVRQVQTCLNPAIYKYEISLFSETKLLEGILLPSVAITQLKGVDSGTFQPRPKRSIYDYLQSYLQQYGTKTNSNYEQGAYGEKFSFGHNINDESDTVASRFGAIECPEFQWNEPTLREVFNDLMMVDDCIPVVQNNVINFIDVSETGSEITDEQKESINYIEKTQSSADYVSEIKMNIRNSTNDTSVVEVCEEIGFRNFQSYILDTENVQIETTFPIWELIHVDVTLQAKGNVEVYEEEGSSQYRDVPIDTETQPIELFDINSTPWSSLYGNSILEYEEWQTKDIYYGGFGREMPLSTDYQNTCLYWKRGSTGIHNFQSKQQHQFLWISSQVSVLELMMNGTYGLVGDRKRQAMYDAASILYPNAWNMFVSEIDDSKFYRCRFKVKYKALSSHVFNASKSDMPRNKRVVVDNQTNSYVDIQKQGLLEYLKANRLGNKVCLINGRYKTDENNMPKLSQKVNNSIIFQKQISVFNNFIKVNYQATENYVLRDYYTGIKSKLRSWRILDGSEAFVRADILKFYANSNLPSVLNANYMFPKYASLDDYINNFNHCMVIFKTKNGDTLPNANMVNYLGNSYNVVGYKLEMSKTKCGNSVLFTIKMPDNSMVGKYIYNENGTGGSYQKNASYVDEDGENVGGIIYFYKDFSPVIGSAGKVISSHLMPAVTYGQFSNMVGKVTFNLKKDNKEITQLTIQFEWNENANDIFLGKK